MYRPKVYNLNADVLMSPWANAIQLFTTVINSVP